MDDLSRIPGNHCPKVFIHRDYTNGTSLCFQLKFPQELEGKVRRTLYSSLTDVEFLHLGHFIRNCKC